LSFSLVCVDGEKSNDPDGSGAKAGLMGKEERNSAADAAGEQPMLLVRIRVMRISIAPFMP
jgi:hypothetical protein